MMPNSDRIGFRLQDAVRRLARGSFIRAVNYHHTLAERRTTYERQLAYFRRYFSAVSEEDLERFYDTGVWHKEKPGLIINLFNGYRNNYDVMKPLLEKYGFTGWFYIVTEFVNAPAPTQRAFAVDHELSLKLGEYDDGRYALSWDEIRELDRNHVIASHTATHKRLGMDDSEEEIRREIVDSQEEIVRQLGHPAGAFAWLYGEEYSGNPRAAKYLLEARYRYLISNFKIQKLST